MHPVFEPLSNLSLLPYPEVPIKVGTSLFLNPGYGMIVMIIKKLQSDAEISPPGATPVAEDFRADRPHRRPPEKAHKKARLATPFASRAFLCA